MPFNILSFITACKIEARAGCSSFSQIFETELFFIFVHKLVRCRQFRHQTIYKTTLGVSFGATNSRKSKNGSDKVIEKRMHRCPQMHFTTVSQPQLVLTLFSTRNLGSRLNRIVRI